MFAYYQKVIKQHIWPAICVVCGLPSTATIDLCDHCYQRLPWLKNCCYQCGASLVTAMSVDAYRCDKCSAEPPVFDRFCGLFFYRRPVTKLISQLKFYRKLECGTVLGELLKAQVNSWYNAAAGFPEVIIPMPLHAKRLRWRGFNQVLEILRPLINSTKNSILLPAISAKISGIAHRHKIKVFHNLVARIQHSKPQATLKKHHRHRNLQRAFQITQKIKYQHVAIVDDVFTTGSTITALSTQLRAAGVEQIDVWCICRS